MGCVVTVLALLLTAELLVLLAQRYRIAALLHSSSIPAGQAQVSDAHQSSV
jgi:hypothetical protein